MEERYTRTYLYLYLYLYPYLFSSSCLSYISFLFPLSSSSSSSSVRFEFVRLSRDSCDEGRFIVASGSLDQVPRTVSFKMYQLQSTSSTRRSNNDNNNNNNNDIELLGQWVYRPGEEERPRRRNIASRSFQHVHGNMVFIYYQTIYIVTFHPNPKSNNNNDNDNDNRNQNQQQQPFCVELATDIPRGSDIYVTRDRIICRLADNQPPIIYDFTGASHGEDRHLNIDINRYLPLSIEEK